MTIDEIKGEENDRLEFKRGLSKDDTRWLKTVVAFAYMNLIENWGSGVKRYIREVTAAGLREPEFIEWPNAIRVNVYRAKGNVDKASKGESKGQSKGDSCGRNPEAVIKKLSENPTLTIPELANIVHLSVSGIEKIIRELKRSGRLHRSGATKNGRWIVES